VIGMIRFRPGLIRVFGMLAGVTILFIALLVANYYFKPLYIAYKLPTLHRAKERRILYDYDHRLLAEQLRRFAWEKKWNSLSHESGELTFYGSDSSLPVVLKGLGPSKIRVGDDRVDFDCGGPGLTYGISVFREGVAGTGTKRLGEGIWFYAEDNVVPDR
jgi:hypothetical protein